MVVDHSVSPALRTRDALLIFDEISTALGRGLMLGVELVRDRNSKDPANEAAESILYRALDRGLSFKISMGNVITLTPPLVIAEDDLDRALDILEACIAEEEAAAA